MNRILKVSAVAFLLVIGIATTYRADHGKFFEISKNIEIFANLYKEINTNYVDDLDPAKLMRTGIDAMLESLDPYTNYISESEIEGFRYLTEGKYNGIGADIRDIDGFITIIEPYHEQPADKAGLKAGDRIVEIDGKSALGKSTNDIGNILKGFPGTEVDLVIQRPGESKDFKVTMVRSEVKVPNVPYSGMLNEDIGYLALTVFTREAGRNVSNAIKELKKDNPELKGIVFDLRGNPGGLLTEAVNVSNVFIPKGELVVTTKGKVEDWDRSFKTLNAPMAEDISLTILMNNNSASASEIVSGVIQDLDRGILIGRRSYGKGLVQQTRDIGYNSKVKMTTAKYYIPSGRCIQSVSYKDGAPLDIDDAKRAPFNTRNGRKVLDGGGVKPDIVIDQDGDSNILELLEKENLIFNFVTQFCLKHESIPAVEDFEFSDFSDFLSFIEKEDFDYNTKSEKMIKDLAKQAKKDALDIGDEIKALKKEIKSSKIEEVSRHEEAITNLIEKEIAGRYYYQPGKIKMGLKNDKEIEEAIKVLNDKKRYEGILKG